MVEDRLRAFLRTVFLNQVEPRQRDVQPRRLGIFEQLYFGGAVALIVFIQALLLSDAVLHVDHVVS
jgi:hypothetical protein